jgi:nicotinamide mononucleotide transporter
MNIVEIVAVLFTLLSVILTVKGNLLCWPSGIIGTIFYSIIFYEHNLLGELFLQGIFLIQCILGWVNWSKPKGELSISWLTRTQRGYLLNATIVTYMISFSLTSMYGGNMPFLDSSVMTLSIMATFLLVKKKIDAWILWIINDIILIILFSMNGLYISSYTYVLFLILASIGLWKWVTDKRRIELVGGQEYIPKNTKD